MINEKINGASSIIIKFIACYLYGLLVFFDRTWSWNN